MSNRLEKATETRQVGTVTKWGRGAVRGKTLSRSDRLGELVVTRQGISSKLGEASGWTMRVVRCAEDIAVTGRGYIKGGQ